MPDQPTLTKQKGAHRPTHVLFFAAVPPAELKARMATAWQSFGTGEPFRNDTLHLSICAVAEVDDIDPVLVQRAGQAARALRTAPFTLCLDRLMTFPVGAASHQLVNATERTSNDLNEIAAELQTACRAMGIAASRPTKIMPHVTLAYGRGFPEVRPLDTSILWTIEEVTLIDSLWGQGRHVPLGHWPLPLDRHQRGFDF